MHPEMSGSKWLHYAATRPRCRVTARPLMRLTDYKVEAFFDEMFTEDGAPRPEAEPLAQRIQELPDGQLLKLHRAAELAMRRMGVTFNVYSDNKGVEKTFPFDLIPRIVSAEEWETIDAGLKQRIHALNIFVNDLYHRQQILKDGIIPREVIESSGGLRQQCVGIHPPKNIWIHITGTDLIRHKDGQIYVLEDNLRCPSGVSYVLENRHLMKNLFPQVFADHRIRPIDSYPFRLREVLENLAPDSITEPLCVVLTPGPYNSAYFEHSILAQQMGVQLVEGRDLVVADGFVWMRTTRGFDRVDVIYRRLDDDFLDPQSFRKDSMLGVPGLMSVYKKGNVALANAPGTGVADDKAIYAYVPKIIKYYFDQDPILPNVPTHLCSEEKELNYVLENLKDLVVKPVNESGGYGMIVGPAASSTELAEFADRIRDNPRNYIAQPTLSLSRVPTICDDKLEGRHVDLRPYILYGKEIHVMPGGLTRVALRKGSLVVNSSQGGGSKDTWVMAK